jgi:hypothetical protein
MKHFKECKPSRENACASLSDSQSKLKRNEALSNAQSKLKRNASLFRQVGNLKVQNLTIRKENMHLK